MAYINHEELKEKAFGKGIPPFYDESDRADWYAKCIIGAEPVNEWISVDERLPEYAYDVIVYDKDVGIVIGWFTEDAGWQTEWNGIDNVTHWQELPKPPKVGD